MYLKSFRSFQPEKWGRSSGFHLMQFWEWYSDGDSFQQGSGLGWAGCQGMSTAMAQTTQSSTTKESLCNSIHPGSHISSQTIWISTLLLVWHTGQEWETKECLSSKAVWRVRCNDKLHRPTQSTPQPQGFESITDTLSILPLLAYLQ